MLQHVGDRFSSMIIENVNGGLDFVADPSISLHPTKMAQAHATV